MEVALTDVEIIAGLHPVQSLEAGRGEELRQGWAFARRYLLHFDFPQIL
jgi:hypothetical protein